MHRKLGNQLLALPRRGKQAILFSADIVILWFALWAAFALRLEVWHVPVPVLLKLATLAPFLAFPIFVRLGLYRAIIRYVGLYALLAIVKAIVLYSILLAASVYLLGFAGVPRSIAPIQGLIAMLLVGGSRVLARHWLISSQRAIEHRPRNRCLIYGAGSAGIQLATALAHSHEFLPVGMIDDDPVLHRSHISNYTVYSPHELPELIERLQVQDILIAIPSASQQRRKEIVTLLETLPVKILILPGVAALAQGKFTVSDLREIDIEDLLGRDPVLPNPKLIGATITGKSVMVTGAGGSIGAELCVQILMLSPKRLVLYELNEFALYQIEKSLHELSSKLPLAALDIHPILGSVCNSSRLKAVMSRFGVETVFHAAAYKHVPMVEMNPVEGVFNNVIGTWRCAEAARSTGVSTFVLISTDKAVRPTNTMGASKRLAEMVLQGLAATNHYKTCFTMVRFGNVIGSSGSVIPLFRDQLKKGGPLTVTDPEITRYFMTIPEAAQLVIQAGAMATGGEVFLLEMGEPIKILELAKRMIQLSGMSIKDDNTPDGDIEITFTGLRPGEKLYEELLIDPNAMATAHPRIMRAKETFPSWQQLEGVLTSLLYAVDHNDSDEIRTILACTVDGFEPQCGNIDLTRQRQSVPLKEFYLVSPT